VIVEAMDLLIAAIKNVILAPGASRSALGTKLRLKNSYKKKVMLGLRVKIREAE